MFSQLQLSARDKFPLSISVTVFLITLTIFRAIRSKEKAFSFKTVPVAPGWLPIFGHLFAMGKTPLFKFMEWHKKLGPLIQVDFGANPLVLIGDATVAQEIFVSMGDSTSSRRRGNFSDEIYAPDGRGLITARYSKRWKNSRRMALTILAPKAIQQFNDAVREEMLQTAQILAAATQRHGNVDPVEILQLASMNIILSTCFAADRLESINDPKFKTIIYFVNKTVEIAGLTGDVGVMFPFLKWIDAFTDRRQKLEAFVRNYRDAPMKELIPGARESVKPSLVKSMDENKDEMNIDELDIVILLTDMLLAGSDTTAVTMTGMMSILVKYPHVQAKIQGEIDAFRQAHDGRLPLFEEKEALPYTISVQRECMRSRSTTNFGVVRVTTDDVWNGYFIPKGRWIAGNMYAIHHDPKRYPEPDKFIPERFQENTKSMAASANGRFEDRDHFNFGWGRRICPGAHLAETELFYTFVAVFSDYDIKPVLDDQGQPLYPVIQNGTLGAVVAKPDQFKIRVLPREVPYQFDRNNSTFET